MGHQMCHFNADFRFDWLSLRSCTIYCLHRHKDSNLNPAVGLQKELPILAAASVAPSLTPSISHSNMQDDPLQANTLPTAHSTFVTTSPVFLSTCKHCSVSSCCASYTSVKVSNEHRVQLLQHVKEMVPLLFAPRLKPLGPQAQLAFKDVW